VVIVKLDAINAAPYFITIQETILPAWRRGRARGS